MKNNLKMKTYIFFCGIILGLSLVTFRGIDNNKGTNPIDVYKYTNINLKTAGYWDLTGSLILIDDNDITRNWSYTASTYDWCSGSGTWKDPYLIENVTIDGRDVGTSLKILNSKTAYFVIKNCTIYNSLDTSGNGGIMLENKKAEKGKKLKKETEEEKTITKGLGFSSFGFASSSYSMPSAISVSLISTGGFRVF